MGRDDWRQTLCYAAAYQLSLLIGVYLDSLSTGQSADAWQRLSGQVFLLEDVMTRLWQLGVGQH